LLWDTFQVVPKALFLSSGRKSHPNRQIGVFPIGTLFYFGRLLRFGIPVAKVCLTRPPLLSGDWTATKPRRHGPVSSSQPCRVDGLQNQ
jgi:hypothetical protein